MDRPSPGLAPVSRSLASRGVRLLALAVIAGPLVAACAQSEPHPRQGGGADDAASQQQDSVEAFSTPGDGATRGGDGSQIRLEPLTRGDLEEANLDGELACSFAKDEGASPLLIARGDVASDEPAFGVVKVAGYVERVASPGGFDGLLDDPSLSGRGKTIDIAVTGPAVGGGESPPRPATLTYLRADGASRSFEGLWQCGP